MKRESCRDHSVDPVRTGANLRLLFREAGWNVSGIRRVLHFSNRNSIYDWFSGRSIPSVDHLLALSDLLRCPMETLLVRYDHVSPLQETAYPEGTLLLGYLCPSAQSMHRILIYGARLLYPLEGTGAG